MLNLFKKTKLTKTIFFVLADIISIIISVWLAFLLRFDFCIPSQYIPFIYRMIGLAIIFILPVFYFQKLYSFSWSYVSTNELISLFKAVTIAFIFLSVAIFASHYFPHFINFPRSVIFVSYFLVFILCGASRFSKRIYLRVMGQNRMFKKERTLIIGAGDAGEQILRSIISSSKNPYYPIGFIDDNPIKKGVVIHGLKVLGKISDISIIAKNLQIKQLIIALPSADGKKIREAVEAGKKAGIWKIKIAPPLSEIIRGQVSFKNLKDVEVEDLLGREQVNLDTKQIESFIKDKSVLITGSAGSIGSELSRQVAKFRPELLLLLDQDETGIFNISKELENNFPNLKICNLIADIADAEKINKIFEKFRPEIIFHAAAYKHVPLMEENADEAVKNNIFGTKNLAKAAVNYNAKKFIFISTDKAVNPSSVMGATKRAGEMVCQLFNEKNKTKFISVRFGNVLNSRGSVIPIFREQIKRGGPVEVTHQEMKRYFMLTSEACLLVLQASAMGQGGEVFVLDMGKPIKILDLAKEMIKLSGLVLDRDITITFTGIRPGEKLFEEMLTAEEGTSATQNNKIFKAKLSAINFFELEKNLENLENILKHDFEQEKIISALKSFVPYYRN
ncbi:MAG: nucleoside-diphosphate sugar epimerase/dehydratase [Candidatus Staskawiczbacteria bacterium]|nr:nucleoside-diphosphate sugar epimerase/dehydratase [Candidatus Staskawiczbacteria bacterium]